MKPTLFECPMFAVIEPMRKHHTLTHHWFNALCLLGYVQLAAGLILLAAYCLPPLQADTDPITVKCWASIAGAGHDALNQSWVNGGPPSVTLAHIQRCAEHDTVTQYWANVGSTA